MKVVLRTGPRETEPAWPRFPLRQWRWVIEAKKWSVLVNQEVSFGQDRDWRHAIDYFGVSITKHFHLGHHHFYYDGPHCNFSLGYVHLNWSLGGCNRCMPGDEDTP